MIFDILTLFPEMFDSLLRYSIIGKIRAAGLITVNLINVRDYAEGRHRVTDDYPYGGGKGMVMKPEPVIRAIRAIREPHPNAQVLLLTPQGIALCQDVAKRLAKAPRLVLVCGRYEGVDERVRDEMDEEISVGDYVLTGGEIAAMVVVDVVSRLLPGALGNIEASDDDSFSHGLLEYPQYTRPREFEGKKVPAVLLSGDHQAIDRWRRREALRRTWQRRPDLLANADLMDEDLEILEDLKASLGGD